MIDDVAEIFKICDKMFEGANIDFNELRVKDIDKSFFNDYQNARLLNSFLFNFSKLQDKIGAKLFRKTLYKLKEIDNEDLPMIDILNILEKLNILNNTIKWDELREIRNSLAHEYPFDTIERVENITLALNGYEILKNIYKNLKNYYETHNL